MTTIAFKDGIFAADSQCTGGGVIVGRHEKIRDFPGGWFAGTGCTSDCMKMHRWIVEGEKRDAEPKIDDNSMALVIMTNGQVRHLDNCLIFYEIDAPFHALGSGAQIAMGAMAAGATATEAVEIACRFDTGSSGPVQTVRVTASPLKIVAS